MSKSCKENRNTFRINNVFIYLFFFFENRAVYEIMWKNIVQMDRPQMTRAHAHCMLDAKGHKQTLRIYYTYCHSTAKMGTRTRLYVTLYGCLVHFSPHDFVHK
jgi:hypothetical protein